MADAHLTPRQLSEILDKLDRIAACVETAQQQLRRTNSKNRAGLLITLDEVRLEALSMRDQIIRIMADRQQSTSAPLGTGAKKGPRSKRQPVGT